MSPDQPELSDEALRAVLETWVETDREHLVPASGTSMLPLIHEGDMLLVVHHVRRWRRGDVMVFRSPDGLIAHRVLHIKRTGGQTVLLTKGDNAPRIDPPVVASQIVGRVVRIDKANGVTIDITAAPWQMLGWLLALLSWGTALLYQGGQRLTRRFWRESTRRKFHRVRRPFLGSLLRVRKWLLALISRGRI